jgi:hypothetical protein
MAASSKLSASASELGSLFGSYPMTGSIKPEHCQRVYDKTTIWRVAGDTLSASRIMPSIKNRQ